MSPEARAELDLAFERARVLDLPISARIAAFVEAVRRLNPEQAGAVDRLIARLGEVGAGSKAPRPGRRMPPFLLPDENGALVSLDDLLSRGPAAIVFYRGHWCPYCRIGAYALAQANERIRALGGQVVGISPERAEFAGRLTADARSPFTMLCDIDNAYAMALNLVVPIGEEMRTLMTRRGRDLAAYHGNEAWLLPIPATFVVARDGRVAARLVDPNMRRRMDVEEIVAAFRTLQQGA